MQAIKIQIRPVHAVTNPTASLMFGNDKDHMSAIKETAAVARMNRSLLRSPLAIVGSGALLNIAYPWPREEVSSGQMLSVQNLEHTPRSDCARHGLLA